MRRRREIISFLELDGHGPKDDFRSIFTLRCPAAEKVKAAIKQVH